MDLIIAFVAGAAALAGYQMWRMTRAGSTWIEAARVVILGGGGPRPVPPRKPGAPE